MYEPYTKQSLPSKEYREPLGSAICVFNSNNNFIIENILRSDVASKYNWYDLIDSTSGQLTFPIKETITKESDGTIEQLFKEIVDQRNRILHSFQITENATDNEQILATKNKSNEQFVITKEYLMDFIEKNDKLSTMLHKFRGF